MIFVTVGTHEQQFNRLIIEIDELKKKGIITDEVFIQTGYSDYEPKYCNWSSILTFNEMSKYIDEARIIITHGGPSSFQSVMQRKKIPIVVPRKYSLDEHVNNHQLDFTRKLVTYNYPIILVEKVEELEETILNYKNDNIHIHSHNNEFIKDFNLVISKMFR